MNITDGKTVTGNKMRFVDFPYTEAERKQIYDRNLAEAKDFIPPKTYSKLEIIKPGEPGFDDCMFDEVIHWTRFEDIEKT